MTNQQIAATLRNNYPTQDHPAARIAYWQLVNSFAQQLTDTNADFAKFRSACDPDAAN